MFMNVVTSPIIEKILAGRGISGEKAVQRFLNPSYEAHLHDPFGLRDMDKAVERILKAARHGERVVVYGDYDIDGITASAVMIEGLAHHGIIATSYIPDRFEEGYGINQAALEHLKEIGTDLVITVDCGVTSVSEAEWATNNGLELIITDHHAVPQVMPVAVAVINPKRPDDTYPFKDLCGAGVAFKVVQALQARTGLPVRGQEKWLLDLVALGTVCDIVTLVDENRVLVTYGLKVMRRTRRPGLRALAAVGGIDITAISSQHLGFVLGPRMNAAGRLDHAARSLELVCGQDEARSAQIAGELDVLNAERRATQASVFKEADAMAETMGGDPVLVLADPGWSHGIVGIVASKLVEKWHKPVLVAQVMGATTKGSARSLGGFNMVEALRSNAELFTKFGGHFYAAGYTLPTDRLDDLRAGLRTFYLSQGSDTPTIPTLIADVELETLRDAGWDLLSEFERLEPFGAANPEPTLAVSHLTVTDVRRIGQDASHLKLNLTDQTGTRIGAIGFGMSARYPEVRIGSNLTAMGRLNKNEWQGTASLQLMLSELRYE